MCTGNVQWNSFIVDSFVEQVLGPYTEVTFVRRLTSLLIMVGLSLEVASKRGSAVLTCPMFVSICAREAIYFSKDVLYCFKLTCNLLHRAKSNAFCTSCSGYYTIFYFPAHSF